MLENAPTVLLDETEPLNGKNKSESTQILLAVLNAGHRKGGTIPRCDGPEHKLKHFHVYGPKLFAAIGRLPDTLLDRSIIVHMQRRTKDQKIARFRQRPATVEAKPIRDSVAHFAKDQHTEIERAYQQILQADLEFLNDRDADLWTPLFSLCSILAPERVADLRTCATVLSAIKSEDDEDDNYSLTLLRDIRTVWPEGTEKYETVLLIEKLKALEESPWSEHQLTPRKLARMLKPFEVKPCNIQIANRRPKGYIFEELKDAFSRYLEEAPQ